MRLERDARFAFRLLARSPVFALTAVLSLAARIASTAAIFSIADALLLRPRVGVANPGTLVDIGRSSAGQGMDNIGYPLFETMRSETRLLAAMSAHRLSPEVMSLGDASASERVFAGLVSGNYFDPRQHSGHVKARGRTPRIAPAAPLDPPVNAWHPALECQVKTGTSSCCRARSTSSSCGR